MTMGIYSLTFIGSKDVYIGQSVNVENRWIAHKKYMKAGTANYKLQRMYNKVGLPSLEILCTTDVKDELNILEAEAFDIFNSIDSGYNIAREPDIHQEGELNGSSKYTNIQIVEVFNLLLDPFNSYKAISDLTGVPRSTVNHIANCEAHSWLSREYPQDYSKLMALRGAARQAVSNSAKAKGKEYPIILSPSGEEFKVEIVSAFAAEHGLDASSLAKVLNRRPKYITHKGWKLKT